VRAAAGPAPGSKNILPRSPTDRPTLKPWRRRFHFRTRGPRFIEEANALDDADTLDLFTEVSRGLASGCGLLSSPQHPNRGANMINLLCI